MTLQLAGRYPRRLQLQDGSIVLVRPMSRADESALVDFFRHVPPDERFYLKDEVTSPAVIRGWIENIDYNHVLPLLALDGNRVVGDAALLRHRSASLQHAGEIRIVVDADYRRRGLGVALIHELSEVAANSGLVEVVFELVDGPQSPAIEAARSLGAVEAGRAVGWVRDPAGDAHDVVFLKLSAKANPAGASS